MIGFLSEVRGYTINRHTPTFQYRKIIQQASQISCHINTSCESLYYFAFMAHQISLFCCTLIVVYRIRLILFYKLTIVHHIVLFRYKLIFAYHIVLFSL